MIASTAPVISHDMQSSLRRTIGKHAVHLRGSLYPKISAATTQITPARTCLLADAHPARTEELVDPSKPIHAPLLEEPQEPGPEDCCQSGCSLCVWDMYRDNLHEYRVQQAMMKGETPPVKALDPFEEMELKLNGLAEEGKGPKASEAEPSTC